LDSLNVVLRQCHTLLCSQERQQYLNPLTRLHVSKDRQMPGERAAQQPHPVARSQLDLGSSIKPLRSRLRRSSMI